ncbi:hypothetical protein C4588_08225 [Candidatus Parcubacteria bacterium]|jgi:ubiquinone/menaquinone biosynthesis C-methylase UbiE|nr:MAG: hypothetical protein C4588_08225 [Candidatus Parcubacteria bacterium]
MSDLLEHISDLDTFLKEVYRILKVNGVITIVTPNIQSLSCKVMGKAWHTLKLNICIIFHLRI